MNSALLLPGLQRSLLRAEQSNPRNAIESLSIWRAESWIQTRIQAQMSSSYCITCSIVSHRETRQHPQTETTTLSFKERTACALSWPQHFPPWVLFLKCCFVEVGSHLDFHKPTNGMQLQRLFLNRKKVLPSFCVFPAALLWIQGEPSTTKYLFVGKKAAEKHPFRPEQEDRWVTSGYPQASLL